MPKQGKTAKGAGVHETAVGIINVKELARDKETLKMKQEGQRRKEGET